MDLSSEAIVLVFTSEADIFESLEYDVYTLGGLGKHRLQRDSNA